VRLADHGHGVEVEGVEVFARRQLGAGWVTVMNLLAIQTGHNSTIGIMEDGAVTALLSQEKLDNIKNSTAFPSAAIHAALTERGLSPSDIDQVIIASQTIFPEHCLEATSESSSPVRPNSSATMRFIKWSRQRLGPIAGECLYQLREMRHRQLSAKAVSLLQARLSDLGLSCKPLHFVDHHLIITGNYLFGNDKVPWYEGPRARI